MKAHKTKNCIKKVIKKTLLATLLATLLVTTLCTQTLCAKTIDEVMSNSWLFGGAAPNTSNATTLPIDYYNINASCSSNGGGTNNESDADSDSCSKSVSLTSKTTGKRYSIQLSASSDCDPRGGASASAGVSLARFIGDPTKIIDGYYTTEYTTYDGANIKTYRQKFKVDQFNVDGTTMYLPVSSNGHPCGTLSCSASASCNSSGWSSSGYSSVRFGDYTCGYKYTYEYYNSEVTTEGNTSKSTDSYERSEVLISSVPYSYNDFTIGDMKQRDILDKYGYYQTSSYIAPMVSDTLKIVANIYKNGITAKIDDSVFSNIINSINSTVNSNSTKLYNQATSNYNDLVNRISSLSSTVSNLYNSLSSSIIKKTYSLSVGSTVPFTGTLVKQNYMGDKNTSLYSTTDGLVLVTWYTIPTTVGDLIIK